MIGTKMMLKFIHKVQFYLKMVVIIKENGIYKTKKKEKDFKYEQMEVNLKDIGEIMFKMEKED